MALIINLFFYGLTDTRSRNFAQARIFLSKKYCATRITSTRIIGYVTYWLRFILHCRQTNSTSQTSISPYKIITSYIATKRFPLSISKTKHRKQHAIIITEEKMAFFSFDVNFSFVCFRALKKHFYWRQRLHWNVSVTGFRNLFGKWSELFGTVPKPWQPQSLFTGCCSDNFLTRIESQGVHTPQIL